jgi:hypothetical protein
MTKYPSPVALPLKHNCGTLSQPVLMTTRLAFRVPKQKCASSLTLFQTRLGLSPTISSAFRNPIYCSCSGRWHALGFNSGHLMSWVVIRSLCIISFMSTLPSKHLSRSQAHLDTLIWEQTCHVSTILRSCVNFIETSFSRICMVLPSRRQRIQEVLQKQSRWLECGNDVVWYVIPGILYMPFADYIY